MDATDSSPALTEEASINAKIFVGGLSWGTSAESFRKYFAQFGEVVSCILPMHPEPDSNGQPRGRGFGFISFKDEATVHKVLDRRFPHIIDGREVDVKRATTPAGPSDASALYMRRVFVGAVPAGPAQTTEEDIRTCLTQFGNVINVTLCMNRLANTHRGFAFATFDTVQAAQACIACPGVHLNGMKLEIRPAEPKRNPYSRPPSEPLLMHSPQAQTIPSNMSYPASGMVPYGGYPPYLSFPYPYPMYSPQMMPPTAVSASGLMSPQLMPVWVPPYPSFTPSDK